MKTALGKWRLAVSSLALLLSVARTPAAQPTAATNASATIDRPPRLDPDYCGTVIPPGIAPLNFIVQEPGTAYRVRIRSVNGRPIEMASLRASVAIAPRPWRELLRANTGQPLYFDISVRDPAGQWRGFNPVTNTIAEAAVDGFLVYRLLGAVYNYYSDLGIYQRDLANFEESEVLHNRTFKQGCVNCHTFRRNRTDLMALNIRLEGTGNPLLVIQSNKVTKVAHTAGYLSWHPSGKLLAFSANQLFQFFHTIGEARDLFDTDSNLRICRLDSNQVVTPLPVAQPDRVETWPAWSPDGRFLYFCSAPKTPFERFRQVRYDLARVSYDLERDAWGSVETLVAAADWRLSATLPRPSPDGRFVVFCFSKYGNFPVHQPSSDLYTFDLQTRRCRRLDINSDQADTWHCWSSNGRWVVFSSKRGNGLFARPYLSYVDEQGRFHKPFLLPQKDPAFYDTFLKTYNLPELVQAPIRVRQADWARAVLKPSRVLTPKVEAAPGTQAAPADLSQGAGDSTYLKGKSDPSPR